MEAPIILKDPFHRSLQAFWSKIESDRISLVHELEGPKDQKKWGTLVASVNAFIGRLRGHITGISSTGFDLVRVSDTLKGSSSDMLEIAHKAELQSQELKEAMDTMAGGITSISKSAVVVANSLSSLSQHTASAVEVTEESVKTMASLSAGITEWADTNRELVSSIGQIRDIVSIIKGITEQTVIIAFNAALEATSAGESGRRFGVVADEIRGLAMRTKDAAKKIESLAEALMEKTEKATPIMEATLEKTASSIRKTEAADNDLRVISTEIGRIKESVDQVSEIIGEQARASERVLSAAGEMHAYVSTSKETAGRVDQVSDSVMSFALRLNDNLCNIKKDGFDEEMEGKLKDYSAELAALLEASLEKGEVGLEQLFDEAYVACEGGRFSAKFTPYFEKYVLPKVLLWSEFHKSLIYVVVMDRSGYMPVHKNPARAGLRMTDDISLGGAQSPTIVSRAFKRPREAGGELVNDVSCPLVIRGRHWGCVRIGYLPLTR